MNNYSEIEFLARGRFATVLKGKHKTSSKYVALKKMWVKTTMVNDNQSSGSSPRSLYNNYLGKCIEREIKILKLINNDPNIIGLIDTFNQDEYAVIVLELMVLDLHELLSNKTLNEFECIFICKQLFQGLSVLHSHHIIHRDLKPANILFDSNGTLKIADLGQARFIFKRNSNKHCVKEKEKESTNCKIKKSTNMVVRGSQIRNEEMKNTNTNLMTNEVGTRWYKSPEILYGTKKYGYSIDMWSVGCIIAEMISGKPLFCGETDIDQLCKIFNILGTINVKKDYCEALQLPDFNKIIFNEICKKDLKEIININKWNGMCIDLIEQCLIFNPNHRITSGNASKHDWLIKEHLNAKQQTINEKLFEKIKTNKNEENKFKMNSKYYNYQSNNENDDDDDDVISITSDILNECDLLNLDCD